LSDHTSDVFVVATANDISKLPPEFTRAERFDAVFFLDLPTRAEKDLIWSLYRRQFAIAANQTRPDDANWTGAEIRACCRLATLLSASLEEAARNIVPVAVTAYDQVEKLRSWAVGRCLSANAPGVYQRHPDARASRKVQRDVTLN
jgi:SpoVK/Ycf46/Vps4 family AAA+-type ATPase